MMALGILSGAFTALALALLIRLAIHKSAWLRFALALIAAPFALRVNELAHGSEMTWTLFLCDVGVIALCCVAWRVVR